MGFYPKWVFVTTVLSLAQVSSCREDTLESHIITYVGGPLVLFSEGVSELYIKPQSLAD